MGGMSEGHVSPGEQRGLEDGAVVRGEAWELEGLWPPESQALPQLRWESGDRLRRSTGQRELGVKTLGRWALGL